MTKKKYRAIVDTAKNKFEAVKDEADKEFDQINGPAWDKYKERVKHNKDAAWWEYWHAIRGGVS